MRVNQERQLANSIFFFFVLNFGDEFLNKTKQKI